MIELTLEDQSKDREILQLMVLMTLSNVKDLSKDMVLQGGNALRFCYGGSRFSNDIDFVLNKTPYSQNTVKKLSQYLNDNLKRYIKNTYSVHYSYKPPLHRITVSVATPGNKKTVRVDIEIIDKVKAHKVNISIAKTKYLPNTYTFVTVESMEELLADKIVAFGGRKILKNIPFEARDIWDLFWLFSNNIKVNTDLVAEKIKEYNITNFEDIFLKRLNKLSDPKSTKYFRMEMIRFIDKDLQDTVLNKKNVENILQLTYTNLNKFYNDYHKRCPAPQI